MKATSPAPLIHLWLPNIFEFKGGIQVYSAFFLQALQSSFPQWQYDVFIKHDCRIDPNFPILAPTQFHFSGQWYLPLRTTAFALQIMGYGWLAKPDLVVATHLNFTLAAYWLKCFAGVPYWTVAHGVEAWNIQRPNLQRALHSADRILAVSGYTRDRLIEEQNLDPAKISVLPNTFDPSRFQIAPKPQHLLDRYQLSADRAIVLTVARLDSSEQYKGYDRIIQALPKIRDRLPNIHYILVGQGNDRPRIESLIERLAVKPYVTLAGFVPDAELVDYYNLCDVFAMPSQGEGFGIVYLEALACGKPVLGGDRDGAVDALCHGELGVLVNPNDVEEIAVKLVEILKKLDPNPNLYNPEILREKVISIYGFAAYQEKVKKLFYSDCYSQQLC
jgi:glycosyltransferase involved in cell wall biosynthesis